MPKLPPDAQLIKALRAGDEQMFGAMLDLATLHGDISQNMHGGRGIIG